MENLRSSLRKSGCMFVPVCCVIVKEHCIRLYNQHFVLWILHGMCIAGLLGKLQWDGATLTVRR